MDFNGKFAADDSRKSGPFGLRQNYCGGAMENPSGRASEKQKHYPRCRSEVVNVKSTAVITRMMKAINSIRWRFRAGPFQTQQTTTVHGASTAGFDALYQRSSLRALACMVLASTPFGCCSYDVGRQYVVTNLNVSPMRSTQK